MQIESDVRETLISVPMNINYKFLLCMCIFVRELSTAEIQSMDSNLVPKPLCVCVCTNYIHV
jgi:hypothetical protein